jgi:tetratricopeptide (TPR) repeat protein
MKREPMVFAVAGMIFGFVLGYMAAGLGHPPTSESRTRLPAEASARSAGAAGASPAYADEVRTLESLAARDKQNVEARIELGRLLMEHAQYEAAARWYREALGLRPADNDVRVDLGASLLSLGRAPDALAEFDQALKNDPSHKQALYNKGLALMRTGREPEAVGVWDGLLKRYPGDPQLQGLKDQMERLRAGRGAGGGPS